MKKWKPCDVYITVVPLLRYFLAAILAIAEAIDPNDIDEFAKAIEKLEADNAMREKMGLNALASVAPFDIKKSIEAMEKIYGRYIEIGTKATKNAVKV